MATFNPNPWRQGQTAPPEPERPEKIQRDYANLTPEELADLEAQLVEQAKALAPALRDRENAVTSEQIMAQILRDPEQGRKNAEQMGDVEFQMEIAPNMNYEGDIDPSVARPHLAKGKRWDQYTRLNKPGFYVLPESPEGGKEYYDYYSDDEGGKRQLTIPQDPDTVNVIGKHVGEPNIWGHEYRHRDRPKFSESTNRIWDVQNAQNEEQLEEAARFMKDSLAYGGGWLLSKKERQKFAEMDEQEAIAEAIRRAKDHEDFYRGRYNDKGQKEYFKGWDTTPYYNRRK